MIYMYFMATFVFLPAVKVLVLEAE